MTNVQNHSSSGRTPTIVHYHKNQPVVQPYKPPEKDPPPGAHLYKDVWFVFRASVQGYLCSTNPVSYGLGLTLGVIKGLISCSENKMPKKLSTDAEAVDFGGTAHTTSLLSQVTILAQRFFAVALPPVILESSYFENYFSEKFGSHLPTLSAQTHYDCSWTRTAQEQSMCSGKSNWPSTYPQWLSWLYIGMHGILTGEEIILRGVKWWEGDSKSKKK